METVRRNAFMRRNLVVQDVQDIYDFRRPDTKEPQEITKSNFSFQYDSDYIGKGSFGEVYKAKHRESDVQVAIKVFRGRGRILKMISNTNYKEMNFLRKMRWQCDNIVDVYGYIIYGLNNLTWVISKLMDCDLSNIMNQLQYYNRHVNLIHYDTDKWPIYILEMLGYIILEDVANALRFAHGINPEQESLVTFAHLNMKPTNIMINGTNYKVAITDFSKMLTNTVGHKDFDTKMSNLSDISYLPPEDPASGKESDIWSVAIIVIYYLTGVHPIFDENRDTTSCIYVDQMEIVNRITGEVRWPIGLVSDAFSAEFKSLINSCVSRKPKERPTASDLYEAAKIKVDQFGQDLRHRIFDSFLNINHVVAQDTANSQKNQQQEIISDVDKSNNLRYIPETVFPASVSFTLAHLPGNPTISIPSDNFSNFTKFEYLDRGGFGDVWKFTDSVLGNSVAIKAIRLGSGINVEMAKNDVQKEVNVHKKLKNPHIVHYIGSHATDGIMFIIIEFVENGSLSKKLRDLATSSTKLPVLPFFTILKYVKQVLQGLLYLHNGNQYVKHTIVHRDLRAENILLDFNDDAKISDFGLSKELNILSSRSQFYTHELGNVYFRAPEMIKNDMDKLGCCVDIWALGITILQMIFVPIPFTQKYTPNNYARLHFKDPEVFESELLKITDDIADLRVKSLAMKCLVYNANDRPTSCQLLKNFPELKACESFTLSHLPEAPFISIPTYMFSSDIDFTYLDRGSYGDVFKFTEPSSGYSVALKKIRFGTSRDAEKAKNNVLKEINIHKNLRNPHIVHYIGSHEENGVIFILMELMTGSLSKKLNLIRQSSTSIPVLPSPTIFKYVKQILLGLHYLHEGDLNVRNRIIHRDLRAPNVLLDSHDNAKIADFGISKQLDTLSSKSEFHTKVGSVFWQAPEMIRCDADVLGRKVDIWSLGITILEMIFGFPDFIRDYEPFGYVRLHYIGGFEKELRKATDQVTDMTLKDLLAKCLVYDATKRPTSSQLLEKIYLLPYNRDFQAKTQNASIS